MADKAHRMNPEREKSCFGGINSHLRMCAFTLIELLVVIAIIAILAAILMPVLDKAKQRALGVQCMANLRQLMFGWKMYNNDSGGIFPVNEGQGQAFDDANVNWVATQMNYDINNTDNTNWALLVDSHWSQLALYVTSAKVYRCPADQSLSGGLTGQPRVRSYSMSQAVGPNTKGTVVDGNRIQGGWLGGSGSSPDPTPPNQPGQWTVYLQESMMVAGLGPADIWVLVDEHPDSINDAAFAVEMPSSPSQTYWIDKPAKYHANACGFSFADGHAEIHGWQVPGAIPDVTYQPIGGQALSVPKNPDVQWVASHTSALWHQ